MEEKKDNKGLLVGIIIFLIICLVAIFYFIFKMTYVENKDNTNNNTSESEQKETTNQEEGFTELTKYELQEGEEKEITIKNKTIKLKRKDDKYYINDKEIENTMGFYVTNKLIFSYNTGQNGEQYKIYNLDGDNLYNTKENEYFWKLRIEDNKLLVDGADTTNYNLEYGTLHIDSIIIEPCELVENGKGKSIKNYNEILEKHKDEVLEGKYDITLNNNDVKFNLVEAQVKVEKYIGDEGFCVIEK